MCAAGSVCTATGGGAAVEEKERVSVFKPNLVHFIKIFGHEGLMSRVTITLEVVVPRSVDVGWNIMREDHLWGFQSVLLFSVWLNTHFEFRSICWYYSTRGKYRCYIFSCSTGCVLFAGNLIILMGCADNGWMNRISFLQTPRFIEMAGLLGYCLWSKHTHTKMHLKLYEMISIKS